MPARARPDGTPRCPTYADKSERDTEERRELVRRFAAVTAWAAPFWELDRRIAALSPKRDKHGIEIAAVRGDWRRRGPASLFRPQPREPRRGDLTLRDLRDVEAILCALTWPIDPRRQKYEHTKGRPRAESPIVFDRYRLRRPEAWREWMAHLPRYLRRRLARRPSLARALKREFHKTAKNGTGRRPKHSHVDRLAHALAAVLFGVEPRTVERASAIIYRLLGVGSGPFKPSEPLRPAEMRIVPASSGVVSYCPRCDGGMTLIACVHEAFEPATSPSRPAR